MTTRGTDEGKFDIGFSTHWYVARWQANSVNRRNSVFDQLQMQSQFTECSTLTTVAGFRAATTVLSSVALHPLPTFIPRAYD
jgi:hypothetical protein